MDRSENQGKPQKKYLLAVAVSLFAAAGFITYQVGVVNETMPLALDLKIQAAVFSLRGTVLNPIVCAITHMSDPVTIVAMCAVLLALPNRKNYGLPVSLACLCGLGIYKPMKHIFLRARPDVSLHLVTQGGYSFPSGHSVTSVVFYGLLLYLIHKHCKNDVLRKILTSVCGFFAVVIGLSRVYVGVHWPTDVLAGWCIGGGVLLLAITILMRLDERKTGKYHSQC